MTIRNPKQEGSNLWDCIPQVGPCPNNCFQCFYNRPGAFYVPIDSPSIPDPEEVGDGILRMNCGHDSNLQRDLVIETAKKYKHFFFNTSIPNFDFPGPVVLTANPKEEDSCVYPHDIDKAWEEGKFQLDNLMFVRLRVSPTNLDLIERGVKCWTEKDIPVVLTFMAYYDQEPPGTKLINHPDDPMAFVLKNDQEFKKVVYRWQKRHINSYWCPTREFKQYVLQRMKKIGGRLVTMCGTLDSNYCKDCMNCEIYYTQTIKHLQEI